MASGSRYCYKICFFSSKVYPATSIISILSSTAGWSVSNIFAVHKNNTLDKSIGTSRKSSVNLLFYSGSKISSNTLPGSPYELLIPNLSTSSIKITGFSTSTYFNALIIFPGIAPTYVLLNPFRDEVSRSPPKDILWNYLPNALAIDSPIDVFPTPGGPTKHIILPYTVLFNFPTAINSRILYFTSSIP